jgi:hypothetical protein
MRAIRYGKSRTSQRTSPSQRMLSSEKDFMRETFIRFSPGLT